MEKKINKGAIVSAQKSRQRALDNYYKAPNHCQYCKKVIKVLENQKIREVKLKKFCNKTCYNSSQIIPQHLKRRKNVPFKGNNKNCIKCNTNFDVQNNRKLKICPKCHLLPVTINHTKKELFKTCKNWQSARTCIRRQAQQVFNYHKKERKCFNCGYSKHIEIAHIKSVADFDENTIVNVINHIENLVALCPNCHWEFDNGLLTF